MKSSKKPVIFDRLSSPFTYVFDLGSVLVVLQPEGGFALYGRWQQNSQRPEVAAGGQKRVTILVTWQREDLPRGGEEVQGQDLQNGGRRDRQKEGRSRKITEGISYGSAPPGKYFFFIRSGPIS